MPAGRHLGAAAPGGGRLCTGGDSLTLLDAAVAPAELYAVLADPRRRPEWQSSLRRVADVVPGAGGAASSGTTWTDVTVVPGIRPRMRTTLAEPPRRWAEEGQWGPFRARLEVNLTARGDGCRVEAHHTVSGLGIGGRAIGGLVAVLARPAIAADLRRAVAVATDAKGV
ncbi:SRPBCC family protein [Nocardioides sp. BGMRC 2183]|nr:SRPBCC family protein [Nocardioides sp. BGMRC 2183]